MIFDLNLSELPAYKNYDGFLAELLNIDDDKTVKEIKKVFKVFSKLSVNQIFVDFAFYNLRNFIKRCKFGFCNLWVEDEVKYSFIESFSWIEPLVTFVLPGFLSLLGSLIVLLIYFPDST